MFSAGKLQRGAVETARLDRPLVAVGHHQLSSLQCKGASKLRALGVPRPRQEICRGASKGRADERQGI
jgi:hypothetical protein